MENPAPAPRPESHRKGREWRRLENAMRVLQSSARARLARTGAQRPCVLIVDDDQATRLLYSVNLELEGFRVLEAVDGRRGLAIARSERPDLVLTDVMMPGLDGFALAEALGRDMRTSRIPLIFLSGETTVGNEARARELGALAYLTKPLDFHALASLAARVLVDSARIRPDRFEGDSPTAA